MKRAWLILIAATGWVASDVLAGEYLVAGERRIPVPVAASAELQESIRAWPAPDRASRPSAPETPDEWKQLQMQRNQARAAGVSAMAKALQVGIERTTLADVRVAELIPADLKPANRNRLFIHLHGGAYVMGAGDAGLSEGLLLASRLGMPLISIDYRMPPDHPFPAAVDDVVSVYRALLENHAPASMIIGGTSAGGGLAFAAMHRLKELGLERPAAVFGGTPWVDLTKSGDTFFINEGVDRILVTYDGLIHASAKLYAGDHDLKHPLISPVYGSFEGFPPAFLVTGTRDLLLSDVARIHRKLVATGAPAELHVYEGMSHADYLVVPDSPESLDMFRTLETFIGKHLE